MKLEITASTSPLHVGLLMLSPSKCETNPQTMDLVPRCALSAVATGEDLCLSLRSDGRHKRKIGIIHYCIKPSSNYETFNISRGKIISSFWLSYQRDQLTCSRTEDSTTGVRATTRKLGSSSSISSGGIQQSCLWKRAYKVLHMPEIYPGLTLNGV